MRPVPRTATADDHAALGRYADFCAACGIADRARRDRLRLARAFLAAHPDLEAWMARPLDARLADLRRIKAWPLVCFLICEREIALDIELL